jgi:nucleoside-diphosphate-sugar epimerase
MTENHPYNNWTFYGATKIAGEHMMKAYHKRFEVNCVGLRYMNVYGPRIVPDYTYPATADVVAIVGAEIVIVDINPDTMLIDYDKLEKAITSKTKADIPVSLKILSVIALRFI